ncbi:hypothetical protein SEA_DONNY_51 [Mycobacterium phage Donny]|uniref:PD-(D/E)XK endonuclease-like domain-containing protein n=2 Tax=Acadianvirus acadian TaxID=1982901 RepID=A0A7M1CMD2_9CAUD|nr:hypothetical protein SEA_DONNY_51 [Mycobacterium phage Donny]QOP65592.1 hypothetical protein SEA_SUIGENERIS_51 [Mycobacterium phage Suigeneris]
MSTVAEMFPARRQPDGSVWYRGGKGDQAGWTSNPDYADPSYFAAGAPEPLPPVLDPSEAQNVSEAGSEPAATTTEESAVTAIDDTGEIMGRQTEWEGYPLPPEPPRYKPKFNGWKQYLLPAPQTSRPTGFTRATTVADTLDDVVGLWKWKRRETALRVLKVCQMDRDAMLSERFKVTAGEALDAIVAALDEPTVGPLDKALDVLDNLQGGKDSAELGTAVHAWLEAIDLGQVLYSDVPEMFRPYVDRYQDILKGFGLIAVPEYVERIVMNDLGEETVTGQIDRIYKIATTGDLILGDVKTSKSLQYSWLSYAVQLAVYGWATKMLNLDGSGWEPMPKLYGVPHPDDEEDDDRPAFAVLMHIPSDQPERGQAVTMDLTWGAETMITSIETRDRRKAAKNGKSVAGIHALPMPSDDGLRLAEARVALTRITTADEGQAVYETYQDVWDDDLGEFAAAVASNL